MAVTPNTVWEVRTTGTDLNGGGFDPTVAGAGVDRSQQDAPHAQATTGSATSGSTTVGLGAAVADASWIGNVVRLSGGTGSQAPIHKTIVAVPNSSTLTVNSSVGLVTGTGVDFRIGGAVASLGYIGQVENRSFRIWVRAGTYAVANVANVPGGRFAPGAAAGTLGTAVVGYGVVRGDGAARPVFVADGDVFGGNNIQNFVGLEFASSTPGTRRNLGAQGAYHGCKTTDINHHGGSVYIGCSLHGGVTGGTFSRCSITPVGGGWGALGTMHRCIVNGANHSGWWDDGFGLTMRATECVFHSFPGIVIRKDGTSGSGSVRDSAWVERCLFVNCVGPCVRAGGLTFGAWAAVIDCAFFNCATRFDPAGLETRGTLILTATPFVNMAGGNFALNDVAGGGAACRAAGLSWMDTATSAMSVVGAVPAAAPSGAVRRLDFSGGFDL